MVRTRFVAVALTFATALPAHANVPVLGRATLSVFRPDATVVEFCATTAVDDGSTIAAETVFLVVGQTNPPLVEHDFPGPTYAGPACIDVDTGGATAGAVDASITLLAAGTSDVIARCEEVVVWGPGLPPTPAAGYCTDSH